MNIRIDRELFQWEKERKIIVELDQPKDNLFVQFFNRKNNEAPLSPLEDGHAKIPNNLLEDSLPIMAIVCDEQKVYARKEFRVLKRPRPINYQDEADILLSINLLLGGKIDESTEDDH